MTTVYPQFVAPFAAFATFAMVTDQSVCCDSSVSSGQQLSPNIGRSGVLLRDFLGFATDYSDVWLAETDSEMLWKRTPMEVLAPR